MKIRQQVPQKEFNNVDLILSLKHEVTITTSISINFLFLINTVNRVIRTELAYFSHLNQQSKVIEGIENVRLLLKVSLTRNRLSLDEQTTLMRNFSAIFYPIPILTSSSAIVYTTLLPLTNICALMITLTARCADPAGSMFCFEGTKDTAGIDPSQSNLSSTDCLRYENQSSARDKVWKYFFRFEDFKQ